jgi:hypothetical protein
MEKNVALDNFFNLVEESHTQEENIKWHPNQVALGEQFPLGKGDFPTDRGTWGCLPLEEPTQVAMGIHDWGLGRSLIKK